jgi:hypothetical protein
VGAGKRNTQLIPADGTGSAGHRCAIFEAGGYKDWFLPSRDELNLMYRNLKTRGLGNFSLWYWSSSEHSKDYAWVQWFTDGVQGIYDKDSTLSVRAVRAF